MERKDLDNLSLQEVSDLLMGDIEKFKSEVATITDIEALNAKMEEVDNLMKADKEYIDSVVYELPDGCDCAFEIGKAPEHFKAGAVHTKIAYFLNKTEVEWQYTLGCFQLVKLWKANPKSISYGAYDSTLRMLNQLKFKGETEWNDILVINEYMSKCHAEYTKDTNWIMYHSSLMNILMDREKLLNKNSVDDNEAVQADMIADAQTNA